jgi:hypothetical protein
MATLCTTLNKVDLFAEIDPILGKGALCKAINTTSLVVEQVVHADKRDEARPGRNHTRKDNSGSHPAHLLGRDEKTKEYRRHGNFDTSWRHERADTGCSRCLDNLIHKGTRRDIESASNLREWENEEDDARADAYARKEVHRIASTHAERLWKRVAEHRNNLDCASIDLYPRGYKSVYLEFEAIVEEDKKACELVLDSLHRSTHKVLVMCLYCNAVATYVINGETVCQKHSKMGSAFYDYD